MKRKTSVKGSFPCAQCTMKFDTLDGVRMHIGRVHEKTIRVPRQRTKMSEEERLAKKRAYNRKWRIRHGMKVRPVAQKEPKTNGSWTAERRAKFNKTWADKKNNTMKPYRGVNDPKVAHIHGEEPMEDPRAFINCCPNCGTSLTAYYLAAKAAHKYA